ncbi:MAG: asparagine synthase C-terminal domain-containing protein [Nitrososphaerota archaeon]|nr:asparagine synthase C-terminal domain-containing protein [Nitrososphaerota archaeon]
MLLQLTLSSREDFHAKYHDLILSAASSWKRVEAFLDGRRVPVQQVAELEARWAMVVLYSRGEPVELSGSGAEVEVSARFASEGVIDPSSWLRIAVSGDRFKVTTDHFSSIPSFVASGEVVGLVQWPKAFRSQTAVRLPPHAMVEVAEGAFSSVVGLDQRASGEVEATPEGLLRALESSVMRNAGSRCAVSLSGGLDSSLLLKLATESSRRVIALTVGVRGSDDLVRAKRVASVLGVDHVAHELNDEEVVQAASYVKRVMGLERPMDISLAAILHLCASLARSHGFSQLLVGQGADELFGGYAKYPEALKRGGVSALRAAMSRDLEELRSNGLVRDYVSAALGGATLTLPYLSPEVLSVAQNLPIHRKVSGHERKVVLREVARIASVPEEAWRADKKAAQYSTGVEKVVRRWLRRTL